MVRVSVKKQMKEEGTVRGRAANGCHRRPVAACQQASSFHSEMRFWNVWNTAHL